MTFGRTRGTKLPLVAFVLLAALFATSCSTLVIDETVISSDSMQGRDNGTPGSANAQSYLIYRLKSMAVGLDHPESTPSVDDAFKQPFDGGTNILGLIPGTDLANQYVIIGAHYDHLGINCRTANPADHICNGATDNGAGVAALLEIGKLIKAHGAPRRSVVLALWDREEDGLLGSNYYTQHPLVPLAQTVAYINFDIQGANLLPSLQNVSFAVGAESGGSTLTSEVKAAIGSGPLQTKLVSSIFGQGRSDYVNFTAVGVPNVFFSDSTGPCYHTAQDELGVVDFWKLDQQAKLAYKLAATLIAADGRPTFAANTPLATFDDALALQSVTNAAISDLGRFTAAQQTQLLAFRDSLNAVVAAGAANFDSNDIASLIAGAAQAVSILTSGTCDGFLSHH
ncbi:MAG: M28 family metallopeptidase [Acidimicrobiia bacterium]